MIYNSVEFDFKSYVRKSFKRILLNFVIYIRHLMIKNNKAITLGSIENISVSL